MSDPQKSVFISYRRNVASFIARAIFMDLRHNGYDVFMDVETIDSGQFDTIILNQIAARGHFLLVLTPGTLERCNEPNDWLRREIEEAIDLGRNIVPLFINSFTFNGSEQYLTGKLAGLTRYNGPTVPHEYFDEAMARLRTRFLKEPAYGTVRPAPPAEQRKVEAKVAEIAAQPAPTKRELSAEDYFNRAMARNDNSDEEIADYTEAIRRKPDYAEAYNSRGVAREAKGDLDRAIADYNQAIRLNPKLAKAYNNRGAARQAKGDLDRAIADYTEAIHLKPDYAEAYNNRGVARQAKGDLDGAIADYTEAIRLKPDYAAAYNNRGSAHKAKGDLGSAIVDYTKAMHFKLDDAVVYYNRGNARRAKGDLDRAITYYTEAICLKPDYANAYINRGSARQVKGELDTAITDYSEAIRLNPDLAEPHWGLGSCYYDLKRYDESLTAYERYLALAGNNPNQSIVNRVAKLKKKLGRK